MLQCRNWGRGTKNAGEWEALTQGKGHTHKGHKGHTHTHTQGKGRTHTREGTHTHTREGRRTHKGRDKHTRGKDKIICCSIPAASYSPVFALRVAGLNTGYFKM